MYIMKKISATLKSISFVIYQIQYLINTIYNKYHLEFMNKNELIIDKYK